MKRTYISPLLSLILGLFVLLFTSCKNELENTTYFASDELTLVQTLEEDLDNFSTYLEILHKTKMYTSLQSYGSYTCFVPTNDAWAPYMQERWQVSSIEEMNSDEQIADLQELVRFHTTCKARKTSAFAEGRMIDTTYTGDFLTTSYLGGSGVANIEINREAKLLKYDISADNGVIHAIDAVLTPYGDAVPIVMEDAGTHTIFVEAMKQTNIFDPLCVITSDEGKRKLFTVFAESDSIFALAGITSFADLAATYADSTNYLDESNGLYRFVAYHVVEAFYYTTDLPDNAFLSTYLANNAIKMSIEDRFFKLNPRTDGGEDVWTSFVMNYSNLPAKNGVYHTVDEVMGVTVPDAEYIIFDPVTDQPEYQAGLVKTHEKVLPSFYADVDWYPSTNTIRFLQMSKNINLGYNVFDCGGCTWYEWTTPILPKGKYELLVCANGGNSARGKFQIYWDGEAVGSLYNLTTKGVNIGYPDSLAMEANGWRAGHEYITNKSGDNQYDNSNCLRFIVTKELLCPVQMRHKIRFKTEKAGGIPLDYIEFIPVN